MLVCGLMAGDEYGSVLWLFLPCLENVVLEDCIIKGKKKMATKLTVNGSDIYMNIARDRCLSYMDKKDGISLDVFNGFNSVLSVLSDVCFHVFANLSGI